MSRCGCCSSYRKRQAAHQACLLIELFLDLELQEIGLLLYVRLVGLYSRCVVGATQAIEGTDSMNASFYVDFVFAVSASEHSNYTSRQRDNEERADILPSSVW